ncbi:hypothetical protein [Herbaspirillum huttiense]|uniref:Uncharacterized protein n=2 Tax=Herbaspirillum huttiense TaxID=863372 RepID=A0AAJ2HDT0_9BURK|nr:hypothetical protein [Herbaspirillum huttiense]MDR9838195.1 hypothetical protein [Herbaspirillum huttiense]
MLSRGQWQWLADHQHGAKTVSLILLWAAVATYSYKFLSVFWWNNKIPIQHRLDVSQMDHLECATDEISKFIIRKRENPDPLTRYDASPLLLEKYMTTTFGSEIVGMRPECVGAYIADTVGWPEPFAIVIVDRETRKNIFRITYLRDYLNR